MGCETSRRLPPQGRKAKETSVIPPIEDGK